MIKITDLEISFDGITYIQKQDLCLPFGKMIGIYGESGCGKTSFLNILSLQEASGTAKVKINEVLCTELPNDEKRAFRLANISYLTQTSQFTSGLTCFEVLKLAAEMTNNDNSIDSIGKILELVQLDINEKTKLYELSGGQRQLLLIAEALIKKSKIILCDEITSSLDSQMSKQIMDVLKNTVEKNETTVIMVTHDRTLNVYFDLVLNFQEKHIVTNQPMYITDNKITSIPPYKIKQSKLLNKAYFKAMRSTKLLFCILIVIGISLTSVGYKYAFQATNHVKNLQNMIERNQYYIINDTSNTNNEQPEFSLYNLHFTDLDYQQISSIHGIQDLQPLLMFQGLERYTNSDGELIDTESCFIFHVSNQSKSIRIDPYFSPLVFSFKDKTYMDYQCSSKINENGEIYLSKSLAQKLGIEEVEGGLKLKFTTLIPTGLDKQISHNLNGEIEIETPKFVEKSLEYEIRGILNNYYPQLIGNDNIYLPEETMNAIFVEVQNNFNGDWLPNTYIVYTDGYITENELAEKLTTINPNFRLIDLSSNIGDIFKDLLAPEKIAQNYLVIILSIVLLLSIVYSYMQYRSDLEFFKPVNAAGLNKGCMNKTLLYNILIEILIVIGGSLVFTNIIYQIGVKTNILVNASNAYNEWIFVNVLAIILSILMVVISYILSFVRLLIGNHYD